jgi:uncharacterized protein (DUF58 family)
LDLLAQAVGVADRQGQPAGLTLFQEHRHHAAASTRGASQVARCA